MKVGQSQRKWKMSQDLPPLDPELLDARDAVFLEPRILFDIAIVSVVPQKDYKKVFYDLSKLEEICKTKYNSKTFDFLIIHLKDRVDYIGTI